MEVMSSRRIFKKIISNTEIWHGIESNIQFISVNYYKDYTTLRPIQRRLNVMKWTLKQHCAFNGLWYFSQQDIIFNVDSTSFELWTWDGRWNNIVFLMACDNSVNKTLFLMSIQHRLNYGRQIDVETTLCS